MSAGATVEGDGRLRLFLALDLPDGVVAELDAWAERHLQGAGRRPSGLHVTLAFLGYQSESALAAITGALREEAAATRAPLLAPLRYRETRSVGMVLLDDPSGEATSLAGRLHVRLEQLGVYRPERRPWLPHVTVVRFRERPRLDPPVPEIEPFTPSGAAAYLSRLRSSGARYEVLESCPLGNEPGG